MLKGPSDHQAAAAKSTYSIQELTNEGMESQELFSAVCNWNQECARTTKELIKQGVMPGTVLQDSRAHAEAIYSIGEYVK